MITKEKLRLIAADIEKAIQSVGAQHNVKLTRGHATYSDNNFTLKVEGAVITEHGEVMTREKQSFLDFATSFGLKPEDLGRVFIYQGVSYKISGLKPRATRYPIVVYNTRTGKGFKFPSETVVRSLKNKNPQVEEQVHIDSSKLPEHLRDLNK